MDENIFIFKDIILKTGYRHYTTFRYPEKYPKNIWMPPDLAGLGDYNSA